MNINIFGLSSLCAFIVCELLAAFVYIKNPTNRINKAFAIETVFIGIWTLFPFVTGIAESQSNVLMFTRLVYIGAILVPPTFLFFVINLIDLHTAKREKYLQIVTYIISVFFLLNSFNSHFIAGVKQAGLTFVIVPGILYHPFFVFFALTIGIGYIKIFIAYKKVAGFKRNQLLYVLVAFLIAGIAGFIHFLAAYGLREVYPHDFLVILFTGIVSYAILKHRAMEVNIAFKRTMVYSLSAGLLTGMFVVLVLTLTNIFSSFAQVHSFQISVVAALLIAILFNPLRNRIQALIDKIFYKKTYDYYATIRKVSQNLATMFDLSRIYVSVGDTVSMTLGLKNLSLFADTPAGGFEAVYHTSKKNKGRKIQEADKSAKDISRIRKRSVVVKLCRKARDIIIKDELPAFEAEYGQDIINAAKHEFNQFSGEAAVPVFVDGRLAIVMVLGEKMSGDMFTSEDINLLNTISDQMAIALKNAVLYKDKVDSARLASIGMMSATFAHEIRNPLTSLKTFAQLMPEKYNDDEFRNSFGKIVEGEIERIDGLITDLLDFSTEKKSSRVNNFDLVALVDETIDYVKGKMEIERKNISIQKKYPDSEIEMSGDAVKLKQTFVNIISNGCQAMNGDGMLKVEIKKNSKHAEVAIADTGEGIAPEDLPKIFDPFITTKEMGIGLGLAISKRIVEDHNGRINVKSRVFKGSTFTVILPVQN